MASVRDLIRKSMQGVEYIDIVDYGTYIKIRNRKKINNNLVMNHVNWLLEKAMEDIKELQYEQNYREVFEPKNVDEFIQYFKKDKSDFVLAPCTDNDRIARIVSLIQEALAVIKFVMGNEVYNQWVENY